MASKFSSAKPIGSMILWQVMHGSFLRCISICWRMEGLAAPCTSLSVDARLITTSGGGSGGLHAQEDLHHGLAAPDR